MTINIHGKEYKTVAERINEFRAQEDCKHFGIETELLTCADIVQIKATIKDTNGRPIATGYAEERRDDGHINKTSAIENCETSAIGRALANFGFAGSEYASANEVSDAIIKQETRKVMEEYANHNIIMLDNIESLNCIRIGILEKDYSTAYEAWNEIPQELQMILWKAASKGGFFSTEERRIMKLPEFRGATVTQSVA